MAKEPPAPLPRADCCEHFPSVCPIRNLIRDEDWGYSVEWSWQCEPGWPLRHRHVFMDEYEADAFELRVRERPLQATLPLA